MKLSNLINAVIFFVFFIYLFLVFVAFSKDSVEFWIKEITQEYTHQQVKEVFYGLGLMLVIQPLLSILLEFTVRFSKCTDSTLRNIIYLYVLINIFVCFSIFIYSAILPWRIPIAE